MRTEAEALAARLDLELPRFKMLTAKDDERVERLRKGR